MRGSILKRCSRSRQFTYALAALARRNDASSPGLSGIVRSARPDWTNFLSAPGIIRTNGLATSNGNLSRPHVGC